MDRLEKIKQIVLHRGLKADGGNSVKAIADRKFKEQIKNIIEEETTLLDLVEFSDGVDDIILSAKKHPVVAVLD